MKDEVRYKQFILDDFQIDAIKSLDKNHSVMVSASTGTGKTLIADYIINKYLKTGQRIIYTAPIKALSNQKYKEFYSEYGEDVGIMTGDLVINPNARILIMTTEIYRNMLVSRDSSVDDVSYVVFDEIHYINDIERGTVWEESIIFSPDNIRFLCLSATVPNAKEFARWIETIKNHNVDVVTYSKRAVPLKHLFFDSSVGMVTGKEYKELLDIEKYNDASFNRFSRRQGKKHDKSKKNFIQTKHYHLINDLDQANLLPCIFFVFSRKASEEKAIELKKDFTSDEEKAKIISVFNKHVKREYSQMESVKLIRKVLPKGIGVHHAGLLPGIKNAVEELFNLGLLKVLYATETFAVGINMPARSVAFSSLEKYDGINFRYLNSKEYFQMAGRAGRRGIDKEGTAVAIIDKRYNNFDKIIKLTSEDTDPIKSQFKLSYNTILNLLNNYDDEETIETILKSSFDYFQRKKSNKNIRIMSSFNNYVRKLMKLGYVDSNNKLTTKGEFARFIYSHELLLTEIFYTDMFDALSIDDILVIIASVIYEPRKNDWFAKIKMKQEYQYLSDIISSNEFVNQNIDKRIVRKLLPIIHYWANGEDFPNLLELTNLHEGDVIRLMRQVVDYLRQIIRASREQDKISKLTDALNKIFRDIIKAEF